MRGAAVHGEAMEMVFGAITLVAIPGINGMPLVQSDHQPVARDLGDDRGRGDGNRDAVATDQGLAWTGQSGGIITIDQGKDRRSGQGANSAGHRQMGGLADVDEIDFIDAGLANANRNRTRHDLIEENFASFGRELLGIVEALGKAAALENHGSGNDGTGERAAPSLIHAGDGTGMLKG